MPVGVAHDEDESAPRELEAGRRSFELEAADLRLRNDRLQPLSGEL
ncbi:MAG TPA: hypothetical protein VFV56_12440 [Gaiellaceae bacterium]|nr:hypothetical protein [Gaiellaceae bacterium]